MKVLVLSPEKKDRESRQRRRLIIRSLEGLKTRLLNPAYGRPPQKKTFRPSLFPDVFYQDELALLKKADWLIADLTEADFKTGFLVSQALSLKKPVLGLFWKILSVNPSFDWKNDDLLFTECFNRDNVHSVIKHFLAFIKMGKARRGRLIVIDGTDGTGKTTQNDLLVKYLKKRGYRVKEIKFPRHQSSFHGKIVDRYLEGEFGNIKTADPYLSALAYALDRLTAKQEIDDWLATGCIVVADRYTTSAQAHQTARVKPEERETFLKWLIEMEYKIHRLPREDIGLFLYSPSEERLKLLKKGRKGRGYLKKEGLDLHEGSPEHLKDAEEMYLYLTEKFEHLVRIDCLGEGGKLLSIDAVHQKIVSTLISRGIIDEKNN